ncbi:MAG: thiamine diphosphokinase [Verrucomicrobiota bacterium]|jgi:thiamine pyrophosphokinase|nr:thiamine diphosphokinase [Verrucomicrobiota bacterium]HCF93918.1 thiamine diphosphokinase [Verrucomicrobiota bacterium]
MTESIACVFCNGVLSDRIEVLRWARQADLLIGADAGAGHLRSLGLCPHAIIGDMDSIGEDPWQGDATIERVVYPVRKDRSDTELAIEWAIAHGADHVWLFGANGGRFDHVLGHCALLLRYPGRVAVWEAGFWVQALGAGQKTEIRTRAGSVISVFPMSNRPRISLHGMEYNLSEQTLDYATHGLSNSVQQEDATIEVHEGVVLACVEGQMV